MTLASHVRKMVSFYPVTAIERYDNGLIRVVRVSGRNPNIVQSHGKREKINMFSDKSRKEMLFRLMTLDADWKSMITLTYPEDFPTDGQRVKVDLNRFLTWFGRWGEADGQRPDVFWFLEFQRRGAPHYHVITSMDVEGRAETPFHIAERWCYQIASQIEYVNRPAALRRWQTMARMFAVHCHRAQIQRLRKADGAIRYAAKYAYKAEQKNVPDGYQNVGRFWGYTRHTPEKTPEVMGVDEGVLRAYLDAVGHPAADWDVLPKHLFGADL